MTKKSPEFRVLVVEDDFHISRLLLVTLQKAGLKTCHAANGRIALELFESFEPHVVLLDIMMPEMDGRETCTRLRKMRPKDGKPVSIIMMTSLNAAEDRIQGLNLGADDYVAKPFNPAVMLARVFAQLRRAHKYDASANGATTAATAPKQTTTAAKIAEPPESLPANWAHCAQCNYMGPRDRFEKLNSQNEIFVRCPHCQTQEFVTTHFKALSQTPAKNATEKMPSRAMGVKKPASLKTPKSVVGLWPEKPSD